MYSMTHLSWCRKTHSEVFSPHSVLKPQWDKSQINKCSHIIQGPLFLQFTPHILCLFKNVVLRSVFRAESAVASTRSRGSTSESQTNKQTNTVFNPVQSKSKLWGQERSTSCGDCSCPPEGPAESHDLLIFCSILFKHTISLATSLFCHILLVLHVDFPVWSWNTSFPVVLFPRLPPSDHPHLLPITATLSSYYPLLVSQILCQAAFVLPHPFFAFPSLVSTLFAYSPFGCVCFAVLPLTASFRSKHFAFELVCCVCLCFIYINDSTRRCPEHLNIWELKHQNLRGQRPWTQCSRTQKLNQRWKRTWTQHRVMWSSWADGWLYTQPKNH